MLTQGFLKGFAKVAQQFRIKLAAIAKDEGLYLPLWVYHHLHFGFDVLDIRINDTADNSINILEKLKEIYGERLRFSLADQELEECLKKNSNFQAHIYTRIYQETLEEDFTHLMFLDIDEYWCSANFNESIKDFLEKNAGFDVCMFQWLMDMPDQQRAMGDFPFQPNLRVQKNPHVKSLLSLKASVSSILIHNYYLKKGSYSLSDGSMIQFAATDRGRGFLPEMVFTEKRLSLSDYFIYHQTLRSQVEYVAGLMRGNKQIGDNSLLKTNRFGYRAFAPEEYTFLWLIDDLILDNYKIGFDTLIHGFQNQWIEAKQFILTRKEAVLEYLNSSQLIQKIHENKVRGLSANFYQHQTVCSLIKAHIKAIDYHELKGICSFTCEVISHNIPYKLIITQGFSATPVTADIHLISEEQLKHHNIRQYHIKINISELSYLIYAKWPPFCLVAQTAEDLILLERAKFRDLAPKLMQAVVKIRRH